MFASTSAFVGSNATSSSRRPSMCSHWSDDSEVSEASSTESFTTDVYDVLEPISYNLPQDLFDLASQSNQCNQHLATTRKNAPVCARHGIVHNACLALPERDHSENDTKTSAKSFSSTNSVKSTFKSAFQKVVAKL